MSITQENKKDKEKIELPTMRDTFESIPEFHTSRGYSTVGAARAKQILRKLFKKPGPVGIFRTGGEGHRYYQEQVFPAGKFFEAGLDISYEILPKDPTTGKRMPPKRIKMILPPFEVVENEQQVHFMVNGMRRWSPGDCVVYYPDTDEFEIWDYKTSGMGFKWLAKAKDSNKAQANLYAARYAQAWDIKIPRYRILYIDKNDWMNVKMFVYNTDVEAAKKSVQTLDFVARYLKDDAGCRDIPWSELATCLNKSEFSKPCPAYCDYEIECLALFNAQFERHFKTHIEIRKHLIQLQKKQTMLKIPPKVAKKTTKKKKSSKKTKKKTTKKKKGVL